MNLFTDVFISIDAKKNSTSEQLRNKGDVRKCEINANRNAAHYLANIME